MTLELLLAVPVLLIAFLACFLYGHMLTVHHAVMSAAAEGAREGAKVPTQLGALDGTRVSDAVRETIDGVLAAHGLSVGPASGVQVVIEDSTAIRCLGQAVEPCPAMTSVTDPAEVRVTVRVEFAAARIPNLLATFGMDISGGHLELCSLSQRDCW